MAIVKCPDCGKMISDLAPACIGCGRPMTPVSGASPAAPPTVSGMTSPLAAPSEEPRRTLVPTPLSPEEENRDVPEGVVRPPIDLPKKKIIAHKIVPPSQEPKKRFTSTKTFTMAFLLTGILSVVAGAFALSQGRQVSKNLIWTFAWVYLSIEAWEFWSWKALLPYPMSVAATVLIGGLLFVNGVEPMSWPYLVVIGVCNIGGLILFYLLLQKSKAIFSERDSRNRNKEKSQDTGAPFWPVALVALIIGGIFHGVYVSNRPVHTPNAGRTNVTSRQFQPAPPAASNIGQPQVSGASAGKVAWIKELAAVASTPTEVAPTTNRVASESIILTDEDILWDEPVTAEDQFHNGVVCEKGGRDNNQAEAVKWYRLAADQGYAPAQSALGVKYLLGEGVSKNGVEAVKWFSMAAEQGYAPAQWGLGQIYATGQGVTRNDTKAVEWYRLAADQGNAPAQYNLGAMYATGHGLPKNDEEAAKWYRMAAEQGDASAQRALGSMYYTGRGVPKNDTEAMK